MAKKPKLPIKIPTKDSGPLDAKTVLKNADLAEGIDKLPELWARYGNTILITLTVVLLSFTAYRYHARTVATQIRAVHEGLGIANLQVDLLSHGEFGDGVLASRFPPEEFSRRRQEIYSGTSSTLADVLETAGTDKAMIKGALRNIADLNWYIAAFPDRPEAGTRPSLAINPKPDDLLKKSASAYQELLTRFPEDLVTVAQARLGLAAIAEQQKLFDEAEKQYQLVATMTGGPASLAMIARRRLELLKITRLPLRPNVINPTASGPLPLLLPAIPPTPTTKP